jgi:predicted nucleotidyltransferase
MGSGKGDATMGAIDPAQIRRVVEESPVRLAVLYGSQADGTAVAESDVDVAVAFEQDLSPDQRLDERIELTTELMRTLGTDAVDVADLDTIRPAVGITALERGQVLVGDRSTVEAYRRRFERERTEEGTHDERMQQFDAILDRLDTKV